MSTMDGNAQKTPFAQSINKFARAKAQDAVAMLGKGLPCTVFSVDGPGIVTVNFEVATSPAPLPRVQMPINKNPYINFPIKKGDIGVALSADVRLGGLTGLGGGTPNLQDTAGNLAAMSFFWLGKAGEAALDPDALELYGNIICTPTELSFFGGSKVSKQDVVGAISTITDSSAKAVLHSLVDALAAYGLITNGTT